ncbi:3-oxoacyl-[acyl-carrier protein] reductase [Hydrobacter penzbergensis]|uniref:3-oxoacyl-[acyl-carrier protein] reductase n=1 Tax=Hydrobacter penzbergensis TaxID=1235997 RepID=A0A8X8LDK0_9BACT|nr:SDR family oxidoreductase [Hydrobacter penzbergensis]SDW85899.1 3-oxoacyl-[acyl-carrier protein] reductase [Hydrobacter penzbergensis]
MRFDFTGKTIIVTGATRGIGKQIADDLAELKANLILTGTNPDEIDMLNRSAITNSTSKKYHCVNFSENESLLEFIDELKKTDRVHGLINNAGINRLNYIDETLIEDWNDMISVNLSAPFQLIRCVSEKMKKQSYGRIVNVASIFSKISKERRSVYSATKFGIHGLTVGVSNDLARHNILVNTLSPGFVLTDLTRKNLSEKEQLEMAQMIPARRLAVTRDISNVAIFLMSDLNQYLTGQNIVVDGGFTNI